MKKVIYQSPPYAFYKIRGKILQFKTLVASLLSKEADQVIGVHSIPSYDFGICHHSKTNTTLTFYSSRENGNKITAYGTEKSISQLEKGLISRIKSLEHNKHIIPMTKRDDKDIKALLKRAEKGHYLDT